MKLLLDQMLKYLIHLIEGLFKCYVFADFQGLKLGWFESMAVRFPAAFVPHFQSEMKFAGFSLFRI